LIAPDASAALVAELEQLAREINQCIAFQKTRTPANTQPPNHLTT